MIARGAKHRDAGLHRQEALDIGVLASDIDDAAQSLADILEHRATAKGINAGNADRHGGFRLHFQQLAGEQEDVAIELGARLIEERVASAL